MSTRAFSPSIEAALSAVVTAYYQKYLRGLGHGVAPDMLSKAVRKIRTSGACAGISRSVCSRVDRATQLANQIRLSDLHDATEVAISDLLDNVEVVCDDEAVYDSMRLATVQKAKSWVLEKLRARCKKYAEEHDLGFAPITVPVPSADGEGSVGDRIFAAAAVFNVPTRDARRHTQLTAIDTMKARCEERWNQIYRHLGL